MADRDVIFAPFRADWLLYEDDDVIVVHKPARVPSEAPNPAVPDDLPARLSEWLARRASAHGRGGGVDDEAVEATPYRAYLGVHQRLDRDTSGVILYARRREANPALARVFEGREAEKEYVVGVVGWRSDARAMVLRHRLVAGRGGRMEVAHARHPGGKDAETVVRVLARNGQRTLLSCRIHTGRTHQIRAQLAAEGSPVAGDAVYGGAVTGPHAAPRLLLHSRSLVLPHPRTATRLSVVAEPPPSFQHWLASGARAPYDDPAVLAERLGDAVQARYALGRLHARGPRPTTCFRLVHEEGDGLPGLSVDVYGDHLVAHFRGEEMRAHEDAVLDALHALGFDGIYVKRRPRQANLLSDSRRVDLAPPAPLRGVPTTDPEIDVYEEGLCLRVRLGDGLSTGLFLDQRDNRRRVRDAAAGARVLNLFAYTCSVTAAAAAGGAALTVSVDASRDVLARGEPSVRLARAVRAGAAEPGAVPEAPAVEDRFVAADVFAYLESALARGQRFDLVVVDPPTYSTTRSSRWTSGNAWRDLGAACMAVVASGGALLASSNDHRMSLARFRKLLHEAARIAGREIVRMKDLPPPRDFPPCVAQADGTLAPHLKSVWITLR
jgi:23S rRNA (cytosine1962-C5)-methyltransferase